MGDREMHVIGKHTDHHFMIVFHLTFQMIIIRAAYQKRNIHKQRFVSSEFFLTYDHPFIFSFAAMLKSLKSFPATVKTLQSFSCNA